MISSISSGKIVDVKVDYRVSGHDGVKAHLAEQIVRRYLDSPDFNGVDASLLTGAMKHLPVDAEGLVVELVAEGAVYANFGHEMTNPHIMGFSHQDAAANHAEVSRRGGVNGAILYPTRKTLAAMGAGTRYAGAPYSAVLALGHGQLDSVFFRADVLAKYRDDPRYDYTLDIGGEIRAREGTPLDGYLKTFSIGFHADPNEDEIVVGVPLRYLHDLSSAEQAYWKSFEHDRQDWMLHPDWVRPHLMGEFPERLSPYAALLEEMELVNQLCDAIGWPHLYRTIYTKANRPTDFGYLIRPTKRELNNFTEQLNKMLIDNMRKEFFAPAQVEATEERRDEEGNVYRAPRGTMAMLRDFMEKTVREDPHGAVPHADATLRLIRKKRSSVAHDIKDNEYDPSVWREQTELVKDAYRTVLTIRQLLQSHPKAAFFEVPPLLEDQAVWPF